MGSDWLGKTIGNCRIDEKIGEGGCGEVFRGVDLMLDRRVAIKVLHPKLAGRLDVAERFRHEAHAMARLSHPNVATLYSFQREAGNYLMVMEYVEGDTFEALLKKGGPMPASRALPLLRQALEGVAHAHRQGILHRDLKATNLMLNRAGVVKVMDFGIAQALGSVDLAEPTGDSTAAASGAVNPVGTPEYMSPEQARGETLDPRADVYALGVLLFKLLTGRLPIRGDNPSDVMRAQIERPPRPIRSLAPNLPEEVARAVERAMEKRLADRFDSAEAFAAALEGGAEPAPEIGDSPASELGGSPAPAIDPPAEMPPPANADPDSELGPTQLMWEPPLRAGGAKRHPVLWGAGALASGAVGLLALWLTQAGRVDVRPTPSEDFEAASLHRLPPLEALPPVGFEHWPYSPAVDPPAGPLGPLDFGVIPVAPALPTPPLSPRAALAGPAESTEGEAASLAPTKKERAPRVAKPQTRRRPVVPSPSAPAVAPPPAEPGSDTADSGGSGKWVIRR